MVLHTRAGCATWNGLKQLCFDDKEQWTNEYTNFVIILSNQEQYVNQYCGVNFFNNYASSPTCTVKNVV